MELECSRQITVYNGNYSRQSGLHKSTHSCGREVYQATVCKRHYKLQLQKTIESVYMYAHKISAMGRKEEAEAMRAKAVAMNVRYEAI